MLTAITSNSVTTVEDLREAVLTCYEAYGAIVDTTRNVAKYFTGHTTVDTRKKSFTHGFCPSCSKCGKLGQWTAILTTLHGGNRKSITHLLALPATSKVISAQLAQRQKTNLETSELTMRRSPQRSSWSVDT